MGYFARGQRFLASTESARSRRAELFCLRNNRHLSADVDRRQHADEIINPTSPDVKNVPRCVVTAVAIHAQAPGFVDGHYVDSHVWG